LIQDKREREVDSREREREQLMREDE
jgi:hypothetical protein